MTRWDPGDKRQILQTIADDKRRPAHARRELGADQPQSPRRRGRTTNAPATQDDQDSDLLAALNFRRNDGLTASDYCELCRSFDQITNDCLDAIGHTLLLSIWKDTDAQLMIDLHVRTNSPIIRSRCHAVIEHIAAYSSIDAAKLQAQEFLDINQENQ
jgi:hypothetical protein